MAELYDLSSSNDILKSKKKWKIFLTILGIIVFTIVFCLSLFFNSKLVMIINTVLSFLYVSLLFSYVKLVNKSFNEQYHMLAKIQHYDHETIIGKINFIDEQLTTINTFETYHIKVEQRSFYVDNTKLDVFDKLKLNMKIKAIIVDNMLIAYEVINDD